MKRAVVTGSGGFLGRHFVRALIRHGWHVRAVEVQGTEEPWDARDYFRFANTRVDLAIHCAAVVGGRQVIDNSPCSQIVDLSLDAECFQWALRTRPGRLVYISSSAAYPVEFQEAHEVYQLREDDIDLTYPLRPDALYGWTKLTGELLAGYAQREGQAVTVVRPFSGYGEDQDPSYPFPAFIERAKRHEDPFTIWGNGEQVRDFIHVDDVVGATLAAVEHGVDGPLNICNGRPTSFNQLAQLVCEAAGYQPQFKYALTAPQGVQYRVGDPTLMRQVYQPKVSLEAGIERALRTQA